MSKKQKKEPVFISGMNERAFERVMQIAHGEYDFAPTVSIEQQAWWYDNAMYCLRGFAFYDYLDAELIYLG